LYCPEMAVHWTGEKVVIDYDFCKGCGICAHECPVKAIAMVPESSEG
ncbi:MAG TPA: pyruvate ferredoxin oxidoreductase, partial [Desulfurococcaceae archaeon]|nr:pyruvate ferredoxin oxidoreductase [Desulfurococcaceae archaeon]